jgi:hypothetical protein
MPLRKFLAVTAIILCSALAPAKDKKKAVLPADVLHARTVLVIVDPTAGVDVRDPNANRVARADVEKALDQWGPVHAGAGGNYRRPRNHATQGQR